MRALALDPQQARKQAERAAEVVAAYAWDRQKLDYFAVIDRLLSRRR
jgi:hypothetical protein